MKQQRKAIALMSGGLDSILAAKIIMEQGIHVEGLNFDIGFGRGGDIDVIDEYKNVLLHPQHGYGANLNPCLDCKIFMVRQAVKWMKQNDCDFIITGEVVGQRPKSQRIDTMPIVSQESGANDLLLRPLCAKLLPPTLPEREGWVNRELLYGMNGRSRKPQIELAQKFGINDYPQPAGGCLLTDPNFCKRLSDLWEHNDKNYTHDDLILLKTGRHLRINNIKIIIGRNESENNILEKYNHKFITMHIIDHPGPTTLIIPPVGAIHESPISTNVIARITARFSNARNQKQVKIQITNPDGASEIITVTPMTPDEIKKEWYI